MNDHFPSLRDYWTAAATQLEKAGISNAHLEAEILIRNFSGSTRAQFYARLTDPIKFPMEGALEDALERRCLREPLAYITGHREFYNLDFSVTPDVLIPRPETELLVERGLNHLRKRCNPKARVVDVGTGSGAVGIAIAHFLPDIRLIGIDCSLAALKIARRNADKLIPNGNYQWLQGDLLTAIDGPIDCLVANLPYVPNRRMMSLAPEIKLYEPQLAITPGAIGTELILRMINQLSRCLPPYAIAIIEIDSDQAEPVANIARKAITASNVTILNDISGQARVVEIIRK